MIDLAHLLPKMVKASGSNPQIEEAAAKLAWRQVSGAGLRAHAIAFRLYRKTLIVSVRDQIWQRQLQSMSSELIFRINRLLNREVVDFIEFRIDPATLDSAPVENLPPKETVRRERSDAIPADLVDAAAKIADVDLRNRFLRAAANCINRRESIALRHRQPEFHNPTTPYAN